MRFVTFRGNENIDKQAPVNAWAMTPTHNKHVSITNESFQTDDAFLGDFMLATYCYRKGKHNCFMLLVVKPEHPL